MTYDNGYVLREKSANELMAIAAKDMAAERAARARQSALCAQGMANLAALRARQKPRGLMSRVFG